MLYDVCADSEIDSAMKYYAVWCNSMRIGMRGGHVSQVVGGSQNIS